MGNEKNNREDLPVIPGDTDCRLFCGNCPIYCECAIKGTDIADYGEACYSHIHTVVQNTGATELKDSGSRRSFPSGAVRDIAEGKGRCDLMPLDIIANVFDRSGDDGIGNVLASMAAFQKSGDVKFLYDAIEDFYEVCSFRGWADIFLDLSLHFEAGAKKYGENNWQKGLPAACYVDSAVRHYLKFVRNDTDEPHGRAFLWNVICCIWSCTHKPEFNNYEKDKEI